MADPFLNTTDFEAIGIWWNQRVADAQDLLDLNEVTASWWSYAVGSDAIVQNITDLDQAVRIVMTTPLNSDIHRPDFSTGIWTYIDYPIPRATAFAVRETTQAVENWEPRLTLDAVTVTPYSPGIEGIKVLAEWTVADSDVTGVTEVRIG